jgi:hypothetical protein
MRRLKDIASSRVKDITITLRAGGSILDPVRELGKMVDMDPVDDCDRETTPLFRWSDGSAFTVDQVRVVVKGLMGAAGRDPADFGAHSLRIGGATAALTGGLGPAQIQIMGRWDSEVYKVYTKLTRELAAGLSVVVGSTSFHDVESGFTTEALDDFIGLSMPGDDDDD